MNQILAELKGIKRDLADIKKNLSDITLTAEEKKLLEESFIHEKQGKLLSTTELKRKLGL
ncbi:MAG: hypothetical protein AABX70_01235 [Nanoarchaeota archaeon]